MPLLACSNEGFEVGVGKSDAADEEDEGTDDGFIASDDAETAVRD